MRNTTLERLKAQAVQFAKTIFFKKRTLTYGVSGGATFFIPFDSGANKIYVTTIFSVAHPPIEHKSRPESFINKSLSLLGFGPAWPPPTHIFTHFAGAT
jgi:hypothetical protein